MRMIFYTLTYKRKPATVPLSAAVQCPVSNLSSGSVRGSGHELLDLCWSTWQPVSVRGSGHELLGLCWPTCQSVSVRGSGHELLDLCWPAVDSVQHEEQADQVEVEDPHQLEYHLTCKVTVYTRNCVQMYTRQNDRFLHVLSMRSRLIR